VPTSTEPTRTLVHVRIEAHRVPHTLASAVGLNGQAAMCSGTRVTTIGQTHSSRVVWGVWGSKAQTREVHPSPILTVSRRLFLESVTCPSAPTLLLLAPLSPTGSGVPVHRVHHQRLNC
jgi:hypothetical protein